MTDRTEFPGKGFKVPLWDKACKRGHLASQVDDVGMVHDDKPFGSSFLVHDVCHFSLEGLGMIESENARFQAMDTMGGNYRTGC